MDRRTRERNAWQERVAVFCLLLAGTLALLVAGIVRGDRFAIICGALLSLSMGINLRTQLRRRPSRGGTPPR